MGRKLLGRSFTPMVTNIMSMYTTWDWRCLDGLRQCFSLLAGSRVVGIAIGWSRLMTTLPLHQIKEKNKHEDKPPFFDFNSLRSRTIQTIMISSALMATGLYTPLIYMVSQRFHSLNAINTFDSGQFGHVPLLPWISYWIWMLNSGKTLNHQRAGVHWVSCRVMYGLFCLFCSELRCRERTGPRRLRFAAGLHGHRLEHRLRHHRPINRPRAYRVSHWTPISVSSKSRPFCLLLAQCKGHFHHHRTDLSSIYVPISSGTHQ